MVKHNYFTASLMIGSHATAGKTLLNVSYDPTRELYYDDTWEAPTLPAAAPIDALAAQLCQALAADPAGLRGMAGELAERYRRTFAPTCQAGSTVKDSTRKSNGSAIANKASDIPADINRVYTRRSAMRLNQNPGRHAGETLCPSHAAATRGGRRSTPT